MANFLVTNSLTETTIISFLQKLLFITAKVFDRIAAEANEEHTPTLATIAFETERKMLNLIINHQEPS